MKVTPVPLYKMSVDLPMWENLNPSTRLGYVREGVVKNGVNECVDFSVDARIQGLFWYGPDLIEMANVQFGTTDICSIVVKIKFNDNVDTLDVVRVFGFDSHYWKLDDEGWNPITPQTSGVRKKYYTAGKLRAMQTDKDGLMTLVHTVDLSELAEGAWNYDPDTVHTVSPDMRFSRIPTGDTDGEIPFTTLEPNGVNNTSFSIYYIAIYNGDMSYLEKGTQK